MSLVIKLKNNSGWLKKMKNRVPSYNRKKSDCTYKSAGVSLKFKQ